MVDLRASPLRSDDDFCIFAYLHALSHSQIPWSTLDYTYQTPHKLKSQHSGINMLWFFNFFLVDRFSVLCDREKCNMEVEEDVSVSLTSCLWANRWSLRYQQEGREMSCTLSIWQNAMARQHGVWLHEGTYSQKQNNCGVVMVNGWFISHIIIQVWFYDFNRIIVS